MQEELYQNQIELFEDIAICLSGGGFRAAGFSLGILSFLHEVVYRDSTLLQKVHGLSSVSGGTIIASF
ncbi:MAG: hypothetical protein AAFO69_13425, partial [Bacteroidota bacterium]